MSSAYFGRHLRELRRSRNLTQKELAESLGIAKSTISMYEKGHHEPNFDTLTKIANFFGAPVGSLVSPSHATEVIKKLLDAGFLTFDANTFLRDEVSGSVKCNAPIIISRDKWDGSPNGAIASAIAESVGL